MTKVTLREATINDLKTLLEFEQGLIEVEKPLDPFLKREKISYYNLKQLITSENTYLIVAIINEELVGSGYLKIENSKEYHKNLKHGYIGFMYVKPSFRGNRISNKILDTLKNWAKKKGLKELRLDVYHNNPSAIKSYERFGFNSSLVNMRMEI